MPAASQSPPSQNRAEGRSAPPRVLADLAGAEPRLAFRTALSRYKGGCLAAIRLAQGTLRDGTRIRPVGNADEITEHLDQPSAVETLVARLETGSRLALSLFALTETTSISLAGLAHSLGILGAEPTGSIVKLLELGLLAIEPSAELGPVDDFRAVLERGNPTRIRLRAHPAVTNGVRTARPDVAPPRLAGPVRQVRESDGLEPILRLGALWQRVGAEPLRQTHQGTLYKRDRDRLTEDPVLACSIADALKPLARLPELWLELARHVGVVERDPAGDRLLAAPSEFWTDNAVHLPQMIAIGWMGLQSWQELETASADANVADTAMPFLRFALLLLLSALGESEWAPLDELAGQLSERWPAWDRLSFVEQSDAALAAARRGAGPSGRARSRATVVSVPRGLAVLETVLLGAAYPLGLVRAALEDTSGRLVVQLTDRGRYVLAVGPTPPPSATFEQFLFVQPNFEVIAYRQGLTPQLAGRLSRFAWWSQIGAALELKLTRESIVLGLDWGLTAEAILDILTRHSQRALPPGITDAITNWASRRERVTYYAAATLIEFGSAADRDHALTFWAASEHAAPLVVADRFLLVEDEKSVPFDRLRLISSRDYRRPPEICALIERDGVTLALDPARSDLLVEAELARFTDLLPPLNSEREPAGTPDRRQFIVTPASLRRGINRGMSAAQLAEWYSRRTGGEVPPAVRLLLAARTSRVPALKASRMLVLNLPAAELLDGLLQHPATSPLLGRRMGPFAVEIADEKLPLLKKALKELGLHLDGE
jgi:Helicase conserved C-terminal domain